MRMLLRLQVTLFVVLFSLQLGTSQDSWKKLSSTADKLMEEGNYSEAGDKYMAAWKLKSKKTELAFKAGDAYYLTRDYAKASKAYQVVKDNNDDFHHVGFKYARCLKSMEQYDDASREFVYFINNYNGDDYKSMSQLVQTEILGCELGIKDADVSQEGIVITHLSESINSGDMEYAPLPFSDDILYFSSDKSGTSKIYRTQYLDGSWTKSKSTDQIFKDVSRPHYGNVSFAPDNSRFYFTQCGTSDSPVKCDIYVVESLADGNWSEPMILPEYINDLNATNTQPCVVHADNKETIYFASNRPGGKGGMDIWYSSRDLNSSSMDFTFPKNLGSRMNTAGDEITPFYDDESSTIYFSSDGHIGYGGFDIYQAQGSEFDWEKPVNMGKPINSPQDDRYFIFENTPENGFLVSNRKSDLSKLTTTDEDIFHFGEDIRELSIKGKLQDSEGNALTGVKITLYEVSSNGQKRIIASQSADNRYQFPLVENKAYVLEASKNSYTSAVHGFEILTGGTSISKDMILGGGMSVSAPEVPNVRPTPPSEVPSITEPAIEEPVVATPDFSDPVEEPKVVPTVSEPAIQEPVEKPIAITETPEPVIHEPVEKPISITETPEPVIHEPAKPIAITETPEPVYEEPVSEPYQPTVSEPVTPETTYASTKNAPSALDPSWYPNHGSGSNGSSSNSSNSSDSSGSSYSSSGSTDYSVTTAYQSGTYYKIQMEAMKSFNRSNYAHVEDIGTVEAEGIPDRGLVRILLGNYYNKEDAIAARDEVRSEGFDRAYVVKYKDGQRVAIKVFYNE